MFLCFRFQLAWVAVAGKSLCEQRMGGRVVAILRANVACQGKCRVEAICGVCNALLCICSSSQGHSNICRGAEHFALEGSLIPHVGVRVAARRYAVVTSFRSVLRPYFKTKIPR